MPDDPVIEPRFLFTQLFNAAVAAADPAVNIRQFLPERPKGRTVVVGAGKAAVEMAAAFDAAFDGPLVGTVVTRHGQAAPAGRIEVLAAAHPVPDEAGLVATQRLLERVGGVGPDDLVVALISGGGSALLPAPPLGMQLGDEIAINEALLASGAPIAAMNTVRKVFSRVKGGRLALAACPARVVSLIVSDIPGDNLALVASGPTVADMTSREDALDIIREYGLKLPQAATKHLMSPQSEPPRADDPRFLRNSVHTVASAAQSLEAAAREAERLGLQAVILSDGVEGEARDVAGVHAAIAREIAHKNRPFPKPVVIISGGETTVTLKQGVCANGSAARGGRNGEFLLALAIGIDGYPNIHAFAADTDGIDGTGDNAGAFIDGTTASRLRARGIRPQDVLARHDSWSAFQTVGSLFSPGPTGTNVNDLRVILVC